MRELKGGCRRGHRAAKHVLKNVNWRGVWKQENLFTYPQLLRSMKALERAWKAYLEEPTK
jgi:hypothetical protein